VYGQVTPDRPDILQINRTFSSADWTGSIFNNERELGKTVVHEGTHVDQLAGKRAGAEAAAYIQANVQILEQSAYRAERNYIVPEAKPVCRAGGCMSPDN
jgi:hypothetical protein